MIRSRSIHTFENREDAAMQLAERFQGRPLTDPLVLAIPRGGVVTGAVLAKRLGAELDVVLSRKLRAPAQREYAIGAISEDGSCYLNPEACDALRLSEQYLAEEKQHQLDEISRRRELFRGTKPAASLRGRSVIVTDDGIATGSTMISALHVAQFQDPLELIVAVPVAPPDRLAAIRALCNEVICLLEAEDFFAVGQYYRDFHPITDFEVIAILTRMSKSNPDREIAP